MTLQESMYKTKETCQTKMVNIEVFSLPLHRIHTKVTLTKYQVNFVLKCWRISRAYDLTVGLLVDQPIDAFAKCLLELDKLVKEQRFSKTSNAQNVDKELIWSVARPTHKADRIKLPRGCRKMEPSIKLCKKAEKKVWKFAYFWQIMYLAT